MHFIREGKVELYYEDREIMLSKGDMFCLFPHHTYTYKISSQGPPLQMIWFAFNGNQAPMVLAPVGLSATTPYLRQIMNTEVELTLLQIMQYMKNRSYRERLALYGLIYQLFGQLLPKQDNEQHLPRTANWVVKSVDFMKTHYAEKLAVKDVADYVGIHRSYFSKTFTETIGVTPIKYLQLLRLEKGSELLLHTALSITEIALTAGYPDLYSFTRAFKAHYGVSPKQYRSSTAIRADRKPGI
jgi:AraC-like DNA-binding protein